ATEIKILTCLEAIKTQVHQNTKLLQVLLKKDANTSVSNDDGPQFNCSVFPLGSRIEVEDRIKDPERLNQLELSEEISLHKVPQTVRYLLLKQTGSDLQMIEQVVE
ncbi:hypothetical protein FSP39_019794, partial [Pinctada imbricata]